MEIRQIKKMDFEVYKIKNNQCCIEYIFESVDGIEYIRPKTCHLYKTIEQSKLDIIYDKLTGYLWKQKAPKPNYSVAKIDEDFEEIKDDKYKRDREWADRLHKPEMDKFKKQRWEEYLNILGSEIMSLDEIEMNILRDKFLIAMEFFGQDLNRLTNFIFNPHPAEDIDVAEIFFKAKFDESVEYLDAAYELLQIGAKLKEKSFAHILDYDNWDKDEKEAIKKEIKIFVHLYGLLGILNRVFIFGLDEYYDSIGNNLDKLYVNTLFMDINLNEKDVLSKQRLQTHEYAKMFFPDVHADLFESYLLQDGKYWTTYSEPVYMFLLSVKLFYEDNKKAQLACISKIESNLGNMNGTITKTEFIYDKERELFRLQYTFNSLIELLAFYTKKQLALSNEAVIICKNMKCGKAFIKNPRKKPEFCTPACGSRKRQNEFQANKRENANHLP